MAVTSVAMPKSVAAQKLGEFRWLALRILRGSGEYDIILRIDKPPVANCGFVNKVKGQGK
jgi:hypothetical protein